MENVAAFLLCIPAFISVLAMFDLNSWIVSVFPQILLEIVLGKQFKNRWGMGKVSQPWGGTGEHGVNRLSDTVSRSHAPEQDGGSGSPNVTPWILDINTRHRDAGK